MKNLLGRILRGGIAAVLVIPVFASSGMDGEQRPSLISTLSEGDEEKWVLPTFENWKVLKEDESFDLHKKHQASLELTVMQLCVPFSSDVPKIKMAMKLEFDEVRCSGLQKLDLRHPQLCYALCQFFEDYALPRESEPFPFQQEESEVPFIYIVRYELDHETYYSLDRSFSRLPLTVQDSWRDRLQKALEDEKTSLRNGLGKFMTSRRRYCSDHSNPTLASLEAEPLGFATSDHPVSLSERLEKRNSAWRKPFRPSIMGQGKKFLGRGEK